ncbi:MAG: PstS family phosphate ABC transporter substrate-binding protein [Pirellulaceae bacterium]
MMSSRRLFQVVLVSAILPGLLWAQAKIDDKLPEYRPAVGVSGNIKSVGSDTMNNLMTLWLEGFRKFYPSVQFEMEGKGSSTAPVALTLGTATFGPMSRPMKPAELDAFEKRFGYKPVGLGTSIDMLAVFVNKDNPLPSLTLPQVDAMFSSTRRLGYPNDIRTWGQLGLDGDWREKPMSLYGRNAASGTYGFFKEKALGEGDFKNDVKEQPGSAAVIQGVAGDRSGIGYAGIGYQTPNVRAIGLAQDDKASVITPTPENAYTGKYPLARFLLMYVNYKPGTQLEPLRREFIRYIFSKQGQEAVVKDGYYPVTAPMARRALEQVGIRANF